MFEKNRERDTAIRILQWETYVSKHCGYIYSRQNGSARYRESAECTIRLYDERIYEVWKSYLTYFDSTPPVLPNPQIQD